MPRVDNPNRPDDPNRVYLAEACGLGRNDGECCAFLTMSPEGFICAREGPLADYLRKRAEAGEMNARRIPTEPRPDCQVFGAGF